MADDIVICWWYCCFVLFDLLIIVSKGLRSLIPYQHPFYHTVLAFHLRHWPALYPVLLGLGTYVAQ